MHNKLTKSNNFNYKYLIKNKLPNTNKFLIADVNEWFFDIYILNNEVDLDDVKTVIQKVKEDIKEWDLDIIALAINATFNVKKILKFDDICYNVIDVNDI